MSALNSIKQEADGGERLGAERDSFDPSTSDASMGETSDDEKWSLLLEPVGGSQLGGAGKSGVGFAPRSLETLRCLGKHDRCSTTVTVGERYDPLLGGGYLPLQSLDLLLLASVDIPRDSSEEGTGDGSFLF